MRFFVHVSCIFLVAEIFSIYAQFFSSALCALRQNQTNSMSSAKRPEFFDAFLSRCPDFHPILNFSQNILSRTHFPQVYCSPSIAFPFSPRPHSISNFDPGQSSFKVSDPPAGNKFIENALDFFATCFRVPRRSPPPAGTPDRPWVGVSLILYLTHNKSPRELFPREVFSGVWKVLGPFVAVALPIFHPGVFVSLNLHISLEVPHRTFLGRGVGDELSRIHGRIRD